VLFEGGRAMLLQVALNGDRRRKDHPSVPLSTDDLVRDAVACVRAGAGAFHIHPRDLQGRFHVGHGARERTVVRHYNLSCSLGRR